MDKVQAFILEELKKQNKEVENIDMSQVEKDIIILDRAEYMKNKKKRIILYCVCGFVSLISSFISIYNFSKSQI